MAASLTLSPLSDACGLRTDIIEALRADRTPIIRWPGGCFVSAYHWQKGVGPVRTPVFGKAWRAEEPNTFGTGTAVEMSDWVEYVNLQTGWEIRYWTCGTAGKRGPCYRADGPEGPR